VHSTCDEKVDLVPIDGPVRTEIVFKDTNLRFCFFIFTRFDQVSDEPMTWHTLPRSDRHHHSKQSILCFSAGDAGDSSVDVTQISNGAYFDIVCGAKTANYTFKEFHQLVFVRNL
jgi:hypothetical protein